MTLLAANLNERPGFDRAEKIGQLLTIAISHGNPIEVARITRIAANEVLNGNCLTKDASLGDVMMRAATSGYGIQWANFIAEEYDVATLGEIVTAKLRAEDIARIPNCTLKTVDALIYGMINSLPDRDPIEGENEA